MMDDKEHDERLRLVVDQIVERCKREGPLVTIHKHYRPISEAMSYGFFLGAGALSGSCMLSVLGYALLSGFNYVFGR